MWHHTIALLLLAAVAGFACAGDDEVSDAAAPDATTSASSPVGPRNLLGKALSIPVTEDASVFEEMAASGDTAYIPVIVELLRFSWTLDEETIAAAARALSDLAGTGEPTPEQFLWDYWAEWVGAHAEVVPPVGFASYKGNLMAALVNPNVGGFLFNGVTARIRLEEIAWGGVERDGIPPLDDPPHIAAAEATYVVGSDRVFGVSINGEHRAYPLRIVNAHEMANDILGGQPFSLAYCTLCGTGIAYKGELDGERLTFGTSGLLYHSNKLMYDRRTETLWEQFGGNPVVGPLAERDIELEVLPSVVTTWDDWLLQHPDTTVLDDDTGVYRAASYRPEDDPASIYYAERQSLEPLFPVWNKSGLLKDKDVVFGISRDGTARAWPLAAVAEEGVINDEVGSGTVVLVSAGPGTGARAYDRGAHKFTAAADGLTALVDETGGRWAVEEEGLVSEASGLRLERVPGRTAYWFGWFSFFPATTLFQVDSTAP